MKQTIKKAFYLLSFIAGFLTSTKNYGVSLYRATGNITNWEKLIAPANSSDTNFTTAPCNN